MSRLEKLKKALEEVRKENEELEKQKTNASRKISIEEAVVLESYLNQIGVDFSADYIMLNGKKPKENIYRIDFYCYPVMNFYEIEFGNTTCDIKTLEASATPTEDIRTGEHEDIWHFLYKKDEFKFYNEEVLHISSSVDNLMYNKDDTPYKRVKIADKMAEEYIIGFDKYVLKNMSLELAMTFSNNPLNGISGCEFESLQHNKFRK